MIAAAKLFVKLCDCGAQPPDHEFQLRPLVGLTTEQATLAWQRAVQEADGRKITARIVKAAVSKLKSSGARESKKSERRHLTGKQVVSMIPSVSCGRSEA